MPKVPEQISFFYDQFSQHPHSVAERIRQRKLAAIFRQAGKDEPGEDDGPGWLDLTPDSTEAEIDTAHRAAFTQPPAPRGTGWLLRADRRTHSCPVVADWKRWDIFVGRDDDFRKVPAEDEARCDAARRADPIAHNGRLKLAWCSAADSGIGMHTPDHIHAETTVDGHHVHIDRIERPRHSPGRALTEVRVFVDGALAGRAGFAGCSQGAGGSDLPAVARLGLSRAITVDVVHGIAFPVVELWEVTP
jgi:hypothetical protein